MNPLTAPQPASLEPSPTLWTRDFVLACLASLLCFASFYFLLATLPVYIVDLGGGQASVGLIIGTFSATSVALRLSVGRASDERGRRLPIVAGAAVLVVSGLLYLGAKTVPLLLALRMLHGAGWALFGTALNALVADLVPGTRRGEAMGYFGMATNLAMAVGPALGVAMMNRLGFATLFVITACTAAAAMVVGALLPDAVPSKPGGAQDPKPGRPRLIEPSAVFPSAIIGLAAITYGAIVAFLPIYAVQRGIENPGLFFTVYAVTLLVVRGFTGRLSDRTGRGVVIVPGLVISSVALALLAAADSTGWLLACAVLYGIGFAALQPATMALIVDRVEPARRGAAMGLFAVAMDAGIGGGSLVWGLVAAAAGFEVMYASAAAVGLLAAAAYVVGARRGLAR